MIDGLKESFNTTASNFINSYQLYLLIFSVFIINVIYRSIFIIYIKELNYFEINVINFYNRYLFRFNVDKIFL